MSWLKYLLGLTILMLALTACGKKGALYLPTNSAELETTPTYTTPLNQKG